MIYVYFLRSRLNRKIYAGCTDKNPKQRLIEHNEGSNDWSRHNGPFELVYYESYHYKTDALHRENFYKTGFGRKIRDAILNAVSAKDARASSFGTSGAKKSSSC